MTGVALCCGFNDYRTSPLNTAVSDASGIYDLLKSDSSFRANPRAFRHSGPIVHKEATAGQILDALSQAADLAQLIWFSFSGHGVLLKGELNLILPGWTDPDAHDFAIPASALESILRANRGKRFVILLDSCHAGAFGMSRDIQPAVQHESERTPATIANAGGIVMSSTAHDRLSYDGNLAEGGINGVFTRAVLEVMKSRRDEQRSLGALELFLESSSRVRAAGSSQTPMLYVNGLTDDFSILSGDPSTTAAEGFYRMSAEVPVGLRKELTLFLDHVRHIARHRQLGISAAEAGVGTPRGSLLRDTSA